MNESTIISTSQSRSHTVEQANNLLALQAWLDQYCNDKGYKGWHHYGPADPALYDATRPRIMLVNSETGGYEDCQSVPADEYLTWIRDGWQTPRYGSVLVSTVRRHIEGQRQGLPSLQYENSWYREAYRDGEGLAEAMRATIYMNARITSNDSNTRYEQKWQVMTDVNEFAFYRKRFVEVMQPEIIICGGTSARDAIFHKDGAFDPASIPVDSVGRVGECIVIVTSHLSCPGYFGGYEGLDQLARECASLYCNLSPEKDC